MRGFIYFCLTTVTAVLGAPQGYNYHQQQPSPTFTSSGSGSASSSQFGSAGTPSFGATNFAGQSSFGGSHVVQSSFGGSHGGQSSFGGSHVSQPSFGGQSSFGGQHNQFQTSAVSGHSQTNSYGDQIRPVEAVVTKRFFLHAAPEEHDEETQTKTIVVGTPRKNYNVVFIKAPAKANQRTKVKIAPAVNEEKTVIYVLTKKSEAQDIQTEIQEVAAPTAKPEVFFIKYKTNEEAAHAQQQIQAQYDSIGGSSQVSDEGIAPISSVIGSLGDGHGDSGVAGHGVSGHGTSEHGSSGHGQQFPSGTINTNSNKAYLPPNYYY